ncbi:MAG: branched-chain amino acid ABC transporter permease [Thermomicrobium sp.]|nr:branched-chain amino acid ABC transporter permease [Thermomicrobium sp.]
MNIAQVLNGLALGALLMILSSGMALIYGLRRVFNFAHGALYMLGAYLAYALTSNGISFWLALILVPLALAVVGAALEVGCFAPLQHRGLIEVGLVTFGVAYIIAYAVKRIWGDSSHPVDAPAVLDGQVTIFGTEYPSYRLLVIGVAGLLATSLILWIRYTRIGLHVRALSHDYETAAILGINVDRTSLIVTCVSAALAGLAGVLAAPYLSATPVMGQAILVTVLIVVVVGGIGSIGGAMMAGLLIGLIQTLGVTWFPSAAVLLPYAIVVAVLLWRPTGLAGKRVF